MNERNIKRNHKWTAHDQVVAEVAAACGCSLNQIKTLFNTSAMQVLRRLNPSQAEKHREYNRRWRKQNQEKSLEIAKNWKNNNKERRKEKDKEWRQKNPEKIKENSRRRRAREYNAINEASNKITPKDIKSLKEAFDWSCAYCGSNATLTIDHVTPLAKGGMHEIDNLLPCCSFCNSSKNCLPVNAWYQSKPFFDKQRWEKILTFHPWIKTQN